MKTIMRSDKRKNPTSVEYKILSFDECKALGSHSHILDRAGKIAQVKITSIKTWKTRPTELEIHCKYGMYEFFTIRIDSNNPNTELVTIIDSASTD